MLNQEIHNYEEQITKYLVNLGIQKSKIKDNILMLTAFVHKSYSADHRNMLSNNERLEFVGDSVLGSVIAKKLFIEYPNFEESSLTLYKIALVREENLALVARELGLGSMLFLGKGENKTGGREKDVILADSLEALIGYIYMDIGFEEAEKFVVKYVYPKVENIHKFSIKSYKTVLQEKIQKQMKVIPEYIDIEHEVDDKKNVLVYKSEIWIAGQKKGEGFGKNKKLAQEDAAKNVVDSMKK